MIISKQTGIVMFVVLVVLLIGGVYYCVQRSGDDVLFTDWFASATRAQVWLFLWGAVAIGVATGRQIGGK